VTKIYLVRHGQASFAADDYDKLSAVGEAQATLLSQCLKNKKLQPDVIITGSMLRHKQTAENSLTYLDRKSLLNIEDERWNEYDHQNILAVYKPEFSTPKLMREYLSTQKEPMTVFRKHFIAAIEAWMAADEDVAKKYNESWRAFGLRVKSALDDIARTHQGKTTIVYTSGGAISLSVCQLLGLPLTQSISINWSLVNAGITKIITRGDNNSLMLSTLNEHDIFEQHIDNSLITYT
jgi:broad specificity phosphatase PhoE